MNQIIKYSKKFIIGEQGTLGKIKIANFTQTYFEQN